MMIRKAKVKEGTEAPVHPRRRENMKSGHFALGLLLFASVAAAQQYVISTYAGGGPSAVAAPGLSVGIGDVEALAMDTRAYRRDWRWMERAVCTAPIRPSIRFAKSP